MHSLTRIAFAVMMVYSISQRSSNADEKPFVPNYDESKIPAYCLPDPLVTESGNPVSSSETWDQVRRPEILKLFEKYVFGRSPDPCKITHRLVSTDDNSIKGKATRREVDVFFGPMDVAPSMRLLIYSPKGIHKSPGFIGLNFDGNHTVEASESIANQGKWIREHGDGNVVRSIDPASRGVAASCWQIEAIVDRGYSLTTIYYGDIDRDLTDARQIGIQSFFRNELSSISPNERWGNISSWSYGLSRALDYLESDTFVDGARIAVIGHSRLGKTALWAGATDTRFKMVISNNSGCGGAALSRRAIGETVGRINRSFPHWFCDNFKTYNENESACPVDQNELISLIAPRPIYVASATEDQWADPKGEYLSALYAAPVYRLLGKEAFAGFNQTSPQPAPETPISIGFIGYHLRTGKHNITAYDWQQYLNFADRHLK